MRTFSPGLTGSGHGGSKLLAAAVGFSPSVPVIWVGLRIAEGQYILRSHGEAERQIVWNAPIQSRTSTMSLARCAQHVRSPPWLHEAKRSSVNAICNSLQLHFMPM